MLTFVNHTAKKNALPETWQGTFVHKQQTVLGHYFANATFAFSF